MALTKADIAENLMDRCGLDKKEAKLFVEHFFEEIRAALAEGCEVKLSGFGHFYLRDKAERPGLNPRSGEKAVVSARRVVVFKASLKWRQLVQNRAHLVNAKQLVNQSQSEKES